MTGHFVRPSRTALLDRAAVLATVATTMAAAGQRWAWQGPTGAPERWVRDTGAKDLDLWCDDGSPDGGDSPALRGLCAALTCARVVDARAPGRLKHVGLAVETATGPALIDVTVGDLCIGPVLLVPAGEITVDPAAHRLTGVAAVADLVVRPVLRGRLPDPARLAEARTSWDTVAEPARRRLVDRLTAQLGTGVVLRLVAALDGAEPDRTLVWRARLPLLRCSLAPAAIRATWSQRRTVVPAGAAAGPFGFRIRGVVVALVGTDGAGKSTVANRLHQRLRRYGLRTGAAYFGMARGNLPGVRFARRLLGVSLPPAGADRSAPAATPPPPAEHHPYLRRIAAWFYAAEYVWRYLLVVAPQKRRRRVVITDRWVYDLRESPWPGSPAARLVQRLVPDPDVLVLPDAPIDVIHGRKPERRRAEQAAQQERYRRLLAEERARYAEVVVDSTGDSPDPLEELVAVVVEAAHRAGPYRRRSG